MPKLAMSALFIVFFAIVAAFGDRASAAAPVYYVSMRSLTTETTASFVLVLKTATADRATSVSGCDGTVYYATSGDAQIIAVARASGEVVHLHRGSEGQAPETMPIKCRFS